MRTPRTWDGRNWIAGLSAILLVGFALRVVKLNDSPLWWDEGNNVYFAHQGLLGVFRESRDTLDTDPPAHRLALGAWKELVGSSPFSMRIFSAMAGVLSVALTWTVGRSLGGKRGALLGAFLVTLAPIHVYYGREAKGYSFITVLALLSTYAWGCKLGYADAGTTRQTSRHKWWALYVLSSAAGVATHYYFALLVLGQGLWTAGSLVVSVVRAELDWRRIIAALSRWLLVVGAVLLLVSPWVVPMFGSTVRGAAGLSVRDSLSLPRYLREVGLTLGAGVAQEGLRASLVGLALSVIALVGLLADNRGAFWATWFAVPLGGAFLIQSVFSFFSPRFLLYLGPVFFLLVARGTLAVGRYLPRVVPVVLILAVIILWAPGLSQVYARPVDRAEDPQPAIAHLHAAAKPGDAVVYVYIWQVGYVLSYYPDHNLTFYRAYWTPQTVGTELESVFASHERLWRLSYRVDVQDASNPANAWLARNAYRMEATWFGNHNLALYVAPDFQTPGVGPVRNEASFDGKIRLRYPHVDARMAPGDVLALPLRWQAVSEIDDDYAVFLHLGLPGKAPIAQGDGRPYGGPDQTKTWLVDEELLDRRALVIPDGVPPGSYRVGVGLYRPSDGYRLPVDGTGGQDMLSLGQVEVVR